MQSVNFFQPGTDAAVDANAIARDRKIAELLAQQGRTPQQGQMVSGHYVAPGAASYVAQLVSALAGGYKERQADDRERAMAQNLATGRAREVSDFIAAGRGTPGQPARDIQPLTPNDDEGNAMPVARAEAVPGTAPDTARQMAIAMSSQNPMLQGAGTDMLKQQMADARRQSILRDAGFGPGGAPAAEGGAAPAGGAGGAAGGLYGLDPRAIALQLSGDPELGKFGQNIIEAQKPQAQREGVIYARNPDGTMKVLLETPRVDSNLQLQRGPGGQVQGVAPIPGATNAVAALAGAEAGAREGAKDAFAPPTAVDMPGGPRLLTPAQQRQMAAGDASAGTLGQRNNNPGNLRPAGASTGFQQFDTPEAGLAALDQNLQAYGKRGINSIEGVIGRWAPSNENNTSAYVAAVSKRLGLDPKAPIDLGNPYVRQALGTAIMLHENGPSILTGGAGAGRGGQGGPAAGAVPTGPGIPLQDETSKKFGQTVATESAQALLAGRDKAKSAADDLLSVGQARGTIKAGAFQGSGADAKLAIAKFINSNIPGVSIDPEKVGNTDYLKSTLGNGVLAQAKSLGANPSNADAERINEIVGSIGKDPQAMTRLLDWREAMGRRAIENHNRTVGDAEARGMKSPYDLRVNPQQAAPAPGGAGGFKIIGVQ